jgi:hypothetical protein
MDYFLKRESLVSVMLLVDGSIPPQAIDLEVADWLGEHSVPFSVIFTKVDKRKKLRPGTRVDPRDNVRAFQGALAAGWRELPPSVMTSSTSGVGRQDVLNHIAALRNFHRERVGPLKVAPQRRAEMREDDAAAAAGARRGGGERAARGEEEGDGSESVMPPLRTDDELQALGGAREAWEEETSEDDIVPPSGLPRALEAARAQAGEPQMPPPAAAAQAKRPAPAAPRPPPAPRAPAAGGATEAPQGKRPSGRPVPGRGKAASGSGGPPGRSGGKPAPGGAGGKAGAAAGKAPRKSAASTGAGSGAKGRR